MPDTRADEIIHPLREAANRVGREVEKFAEVLDGYNPRRALNDEEKSEMAFGLIEEFQIIAQNTVLRLQEQHARRNNGTQKHIEHYSSPDAIDNDESVSAANCTKTTLEDLHRWEIESRTWDLLRRMATIDNISAGTEIKNSIHRYSPESEVWASFLDSDKLGLERSTVLQWLKDSADLDRPPIHEMVQDLQANAQRGEITAHGWLHTKEAIKKQKRLHAWPYILDHTSPDVQRIHLNQTKTEPLISQLDPDAPARQDRKLEAPDEYFERSIWLGCFELLRRGRTGKDIQDWCQERQEVWRAVSMSGLPELDMSPADSVADSKSKALWRRMCHALANREGIDKYEAAMYGVLSGDYYSVLPVCEIWDDHLFLHYNALVRSQYETYVLKNFPDRISQKALSQFNAFDAAQFYNGDQTTAHKIVLQVNDVPNMEAELSNSMKYLQGVLVAKNFHDFIIQQGIALAVQKKPEYFKQRLFKYSSSAMPKGEGIDDPFVKITNFDGMRAITHMLLVYKSFGMHFKRGHDLEAMENIIVTYIEILRLSAKEELIPLYAVQLSEARCYETLSRVLVDVTDDSQRVTQIKLMNELGLDIHRFVKGQMSAVFDDHTDTTTGYPAEGFRIVPEGKLPITQNLTVVTPDFIGAEFASDSEEWLMIRAFEWFGYVDGLWVDTFQTGVKLYKRFFKQQNLRACRALREAMPTESVCELKSEPMLGGIYNLEQLLDDTHEDLPAAIDKGADRNVFSQLRRYMGHTARLYQDLETLTYAISYCEDIAGGLHEIREAQEEQRYAASAQLRSAFKDNFDVLKKEFEKILLKPFLEESYTLGMYSPFSHPSVSPSILFLGWIWMTWMFGVN